jgi:hypothetical protein
VHNLVLEFFQESISEADKVSGGAKKIDRVAEAARNTSPGADTSQRAARSLAQMSRQLRSFVGQFPVNSGGAENQAAE